MARNNLFTEPLIGGKTFHVYNQTNNKEVMFKNVFDRGKFLNNLKNFISPFAHILNYNLMLNHFHLTIEVYEKEHLLTRMSIFEIESLPQACKALVLSEEDNMDEILSNRFGSMFKGYATTHNHRHRRSGNFFHRPFCRKRIDDEFYFKQVIYYIHANAIRHGVEDRILDYAWTSYHQLIQNDDSLLSLNRLFERFGGKEKLLKFHARKQILIDPEKFVIEEEDVFQLIKEESSK